MEIFTIGHSTRSLAELIELLKNYGVRQLADIRSIPRSRHTPQFNGDVLGADLGRNRIRYLHLKELGGRRHRVKGSVNSGWRNASFQGYADYMQTVEFRRGIKRLLEIASEGTTAIMCAEAVPWRCHRSLVADALSVRGFDVRHILSLAKAQPHELTSFAKVQGEWITYPREEVADENQLPMSFPRAKHQ